MGDVRGPQGSGSQSAGGDDGRFPWMQPVNEDLVVDVEPDGPNYMLVAAGIVVITLFSAFIYYIYVQGQEFDIKQEVQVIEPDESPVRVEPEVRGGIEVPHQERLVFDRVTGETTPVEDNLRSAPEEPLSLDVPPQDGATLKDSAVDGTSPSETSTDTISPAKADAGEPSKAMTPGIQSNAMDTPKARYLVQVGAFGSLEAADKFWSGLQGKYPMILKGLSDEVQRAELATRVLYRLRIGYMMTRGEADRVCSDLKSRGQDCIVVSPE